MGHMARRFEELPGPKPTLERQQRDIFRCAHFDRVPLSPSLTMAYGEKWRHTDESGGFAQFGLIGRKRQMQHTGPDPI
jgi:hypothetical protein